LSRKAKAKAKDLSRKAKAKAKDLGRKAKAKAKDLTKVSKAKAKDLVIVSKAKAKDLLKIMTKDQVKNFIGPTKEQKLIRFQVSPYKLSWVTETVALISNNKGITITFSLNKYFNSIQNEQF